MQLLKAFAEGTLRFVRVAHSSAPAIAILLAALVGLLLVLSVAHVVLGACHTATTREAGTPARILSELLGGKLELLITAEQCRDAAKSSPWLLLSGLAAAPAVLL